MAKEIELTAVYDDDSKNYHRFKIREAEGVAGSIYVSKDSQGIPEAVNVCLVTKARAAADTEKAKEAEAEADKAKAGPGELDQGR